MQEVAAKKNKPGQKPITVENVLAEIAKEKAILNGSPVKKRNVPGGKAKIGEDVHPLKPNFEILEPDYDLVMRNKNEANKPGSPKQSPTPRKLDKPGRAGRLFTPPPPEKPKASLINKFGSALKGLKGMDKLASVSIKSKEEVPEPEP